jgi:ABC-2 type transport system ATP-binding protein
MAVDGVTFEIAQGECYGLLGPNGAGKTTTISMVCGLLRPDAGEVTICGVPLAPATSAALAARSSVGYVPQELALYPELSAVDNLRFFGRLYGLTGHALAERIDATLDTVGLTERGDDRIGGYSGGMKRRVNIAAGLLHEPRLLVLDEPTVGVDPQSRNAILETVARLRTEGMAILFTTHYMEEAARLCQRIGIIDGGRLIAEGTLRHLTGELGGPDRIRLTAAGDPSAMADACAATAGIGSVSVTGDVLEVTAPAGRRLLPAVVALAAAHGVELIGAEVVEPDLEQVFLALTGKELRD